MKIGFFFHTIATPAPETTHVPPISLLRVPPISLQLEQLKQLYQKTSKQIGWNSTHAKINYTNAQKLQNVADGKDNDNGEACKKYPEAC